VERDPALRRFEIDALIVWGGLTVLAFVVTKARLDVALGVAAGGGLMAVSYFGIKGGADVLVAAAEPSRSRRRAVVIAALKFLGRLALLALGAYVILTRLRLHPLGVLAGASVPVVAAAMQVPRLLGRSVPPRNQR
jgi:uncharacterized membrane protein YadS